MTSVRAIPTSRAYWELRAEQVLNRVFSPEAPIEVEVCETPGPAGAAPFAPPRPQPRAGSPGPRQAPRPTARAGAVSRARQRMSSAWSGSLQHQPALVIAAVGLTVTTLAGSALIGLSLWSQGQQALRQERNMLLVERLRAMGPATLPTTAAAEVPAAPTLDPVEAGQAAAGDELPPPPVEPWMEELATLPASSAPRANVLKVPMSARVSKPAPAAATGSGPSQPSPAPAADDPSLPQLVGVVQVPGQGGSAIFQVGGSSTSAAIGDAIGSSGWRLQSASGDAAVIERNGQQRRISISSGS
ncbi:hypothetical protein [Cyanobium sp. CH-040]|uniref:hypothetical protein n=1 Tax=Cyanobium sp. CH-040 TaxID=2823708 RepID=UPI0020CDEE94|nr:hypothetical protein [Cyanobium sp. CH-040]MCP9928271.1 hypothetical protein [Cyanobium sp. CH-040]